MKSRSRVRWIHFEVLTALALTACGNGTDTNAPASEPEADANGEAGSTSGGGTTGVAGQSASGGAPSVPSGGAPSEPDATGEPSELAYLDCDSDTQVGMFRVDLAPDDDAAPQFTSVTGSVTDGVVPTDVPVVVSEAGDCRLLRNPDFSCDPSCAALETCGDDGCIPYPAAHSVGEVTITGLLVPLVMSPSGRNSYSNPVSAMLPHPGFEPASEIVLSAAGDEFEGFTLRGWGISPLRVPDSTVTVSNDVPIEIRWEAPEEVGPGKMYVALNIDNHGSSTARIECLTEDDGELDVDAELAMSLMDQGTSGLPSLLLRRQTADAAELAPGCVEFLVASELVRSVEVEGLISCSSTDDCPEGQECLADLSCGAP